MKKIFENVFRPVNPSPAALITTIDENGKPNIITLGEVFNVSIGRPLIAGIAIRSATYSYSLIQKTREFVINLATVELAAKVDKCGSVSGRSGMDKFKEFGLTPAPATYVKPPIIDECPVNLECRVMDIRAVGDHDLILGEVLAVHADESALDDKGGLDISRLDLLVHVNGGYWHLGKKIGAIGFSRK